MASIHELLPQVAASIGAVAKTRQNVAQNYSFRGIDDFLNAVHSAMAEHGVSMLPKVLDHRVEFRARTNGVTTHVFLTMEYTFTAPDGSSVVISTVGEAADVADKATNKAMSAALKYAIMQTFTVPTEDIADGDSETPDMGETPYVPVETITLADTEVLKQMFEAITDPNPDVKKNARNIAKTDFVNTFGALANIPATRLIEAQEWITKRVEQWLADQPAEPGVEDRTYPS